MGVQHLLHFAFAISDVLFYKVRCLYQNPNILNVFSKNIIFVKKKPSTFLTSDTNVIIYSNICCPVQVKVIKINDILKYCNFKNIVSLYVNQTLVVISVDFILYISHFKPYSCLCTIVFPHSIPSFSPLRGAACYRA